MKGLTVIELIISVAVVLTLAVLITGAFGKFRDARVLDASAEEIVNLISEARSKTLGSKNSLQYGIHFENNRLVLFEGTVFSEPNPENRESGIPSQAEISLISLNGGGPDMVFQKLTGETSQYGTINLSIKREPSKIRIININQAGIITVQ